MKFIKNHFCKTLDNYVGVAISQREYNGKKRWFWEQEDKGKVIANEIKHCPYCGDCLDNEPVKENNNEIL